MFKNLSSTNHNHTLAMSTATSNSWVPDSGTIAEAIAAAYAGTDYGKAKMLAAIRGGHSVAILRRDTFKQAAVMAACGYPGFTLNADKSVYTKAGRGKTLNNDFSMAAAAAKIRLPEMGESLSGWYKATTSTPTTEIKVPESGTTAGTTVSEISVPDSGTVASINNGDTRTPPPHQGTTVPETKAVPDSGTMVEQATQAAKTATVDNVGDLVALINDTLADDELGALIFELQALQVKRNQVKLAA
jgi:hypothetical protein